MALSLPPGHLPCVRTFWMPPAQRQDVYPVGRVSGATVLYARLDRAHRLRPLELEAKLGSQHPLKFAQAVWCVAHCAGRQASLQAIGCECSGSLSDVPLHRMQPVAAVGNVGYAQI